MRCSSGNRPRTPDKRAARHVEQPSRRFTEQILGEMYDYESHIRLGEMLDARGGLPTTSCTSPPAVGIATCGTTSSGCSPSTPSTHAVRRRCMSARCSSTSSSVYQPTGGLFTVPVRALHLGRPGRAVELNASYLLDGVKYLQAEERPVDVPGLFDLDKESA